MPQDPFVEQIHGLLFHVGRITGHGALFRLEDGVCVAGPCAGERLKPWPVAVIDGVVTTA